MRRAWPLLLLAAAGVALRSEKTVEFNRDVRPILSDKCFVCHGPDAASKGVPFRLDEFAHFKPILFFCWSANTVRKSMRPSENMFDYMGSSHRRDVTLGA